MGPAGVRHSMRRDLVDVDLLLLRQQLWRHDVLEGEQDLEAGDEAVTIVVGLQEKVIFRSSASAAALYKILLFVGVLVEWCKHKIREIYPKLLLKN